MTLKVHRRTPLVPVRVLEAPDGHDVIIEGRLDVHTVPDIRDAIHAVILRGPGDLRLHVGEAEIGDATGLGVIVHLHRRATRAQRRLLLVGASPRTTRLLRGCRLDRLLISAHSSPAHSGPTQLGSGLTGPAHPAPVHSSAGYATVAPLTA